MYKTIGKKVERVDGYEKVTGKALYGDDLKFPGMLHAVCRYADISCGKIIRLDVNPAREIGEVAAVMVHDDIPGQKFLGPIRADQSPLVKDRVNFQGDVIAVVAASSKEKALKAAELIEVEYEPEAGIFDPLEAVKPEAKLVHPQYKSNVVVHYPLRKGNINKGFIESDKVITRTYRTGFAEHAYLEPETVTAVPDPVSRGVKIFGSIQNPFTTRRIIAQFLGFNLNRVNVLSSTLGGSFGGKDDIVNMMACRCALLALKTQKPVKLTNSREASLRESYKRHPYVMTYKVGFTNDGKLRAMEIDIIADSGAYSSQSFFVTWRSVVQATGPYEIENVKTDIRAVYTNNCYTAAFRGFGSPQVIFAQESLMDEIAQECGLTPLEIRRLNGYGQDSVTASGQRLSDHEVSLQQVLDQAVEKCDYNIRMKKYQELNKSQQLYRYGIGIACSYRGCSLGAEGTDATSAIVSVQADGSVYLLAALNENGQGLRTTFCQVTAEILGVPISRIVFLEPQTATISDGGPTVASRSTLMGGKAIELAALQVKETIFTANRDLLKTRDIGKIRWEDNKIINPGKKISIDFPEAAANAYRQGRNLSAYGWYKAPEVNWEEKTGQGNAYFTYVYGCQVVEVKVDQETGKIDILEITAAHDAGRIINRLGAEGQLQGGVVQGIGYAIMEDFNQQLGTVKSVNFDEYLIPTSKDIPRINAIFVENPDKFGPFGAKSLGEPTLELTAAAINNAVSNALGRRFYEIPLTLEQIFLGRHLHKPARQSEKALTTDKIGLSNASLQKCRIVTPKSFSEALRLMSEDRFRILAGGTDVLVQARHHQQPANLINIGDIPELKRIEDIGNTIEIGSGVTINQILESNLIVKYFPLLRKACGLIGSKQIRNRATIGGNIVNAAPCADSVPPLILYGASYELVSDQGKRLVSALDFTEGSYQTCIRPEEIMTRIILPKPDHHFYTAYYQLGRRNAVNITRMSISAAIAFTDNTNLVQECRLIDGAMFSRPHRLGIIENLLTGKILISDLISEIAKPLELFCREQIGNRWSSDYKIPVFINLVMRALKDIARERGLI